MLPSLVSSGSQRRLAPYAVSLAADGQRATEEFRVADKVTKSRTRQQLLARAQLEDHITRLALEEAHRQVRPMRSRASMDEQKRFLASLDVERAEERAAAVRADGRRRFWEASPALVGVSAASTNSLLAEQREVDFQRRRIEHQLQRDARIAQLQATQLQRASSLAAASATRLRNASVRAAERQSERSLHKSRPPTLPVARSAPALQWLSESAAEAGAAVRRVRPDADDYAAQNVMDAPLAHAPSAVSADSLPANGAADGAGDDASAAAAAREARGVLSVSYSD